MHAFIDLSLYWHC